MKIFDTIFDCIFSLSEDFFNAFENGLKFSFNSIKDVAKKYIYSSTFILFMLIFSLPFIFTRSCSWAPDFSDSGQIGDTFGIMNPFIAIIAAILTFIAFWTQYCANKEMLKKDARQKIEHQFYEMLHIHKENVNELKMKQWSIIESTSTNPFSEKDDNKYGFHLISGRQVFEYHTTEFFLIVRGLLYAINKVIKRSKTLHCRITFSNRELDDLVLVAKTAYNIYMEGLATKISSFFSNPSIAKKYFKELDKEIKSAQKQNDETKINITYFESKIPKCKNFLFKDKKGYIFLYTYIFISWEKYHFQHYTPDANKGFRVMSGTDLFTGHYYEINHYYRHLYQTVKTVANYDTKIIPYKEKRNYLKILRAQLTSDEQALLFYNWLSEYGSNWENEENHFFTTYRMIHNINPELLSIFKKVGNNKIIQMIKDKNPEYNEYENDNLFEFEDRLI